MHVRLFVAVSTLALASCGEGEFSDLKQFVDQSGQDLRGRVDALPQVKAYEPMTYNAFDLPDPFRPRKIEPEKGSGNGPSPDLNRRKEALEGYPLESLKMVGTLERAQSTLGPDKNPGQ
jgi:type IV pilus assembly protein PilP